MADLRVDGGVDWEVELGEHGEVPALPGADDGVLRIGCWDSVLFRLPVGTVPRLAGAPKLVVLDECGGELQVEGHVAAEFSDWEAQWRPARPGPYELFVRHTAWEESGATTTEGPRWRIVVDPELSINGTPLPARAIVQLTMLSRCSGPIEKWPQVLAPQAALGYNMVHFTPIQPPGESGSCYSLDDQNAVDPTLLQAPAATHKERLATVKAAVTELEKKHGMLSAMDIVLNHTAGTAPWLLDHPDSAYSLGNCPHFAAAVELDERLAWYSNELRDGRLGGPHIRDQGDLGRVLDGVRQHVLGHLKLHEYYRVDEGASLQAWSAACPAGVVFEREDYEAVKASVLPTLGAKRSGAVVDGKVARRMCRDEGALRGFIRRLEGELKSEFQKIEGDILDALKGAITWERLECQRGPVGDGALSLVPRYFRRVKLSAKAQERLGKDTEVLAHNGWVMDWPATEDFAAPAWRAVYLRRHLCAWGDCVKLRFGQTPEDAPFLWDYMTRYAVSMAEIFHAIRLDNAHSTPLHVSQHVLAAVRKANPHCWVFAELFTGSFKTDLLYQGTLGINALIREALQCHSPQDIAGKLSSSLWGAHPIGAVSNVPTLDRVPSAAAAPPGVRTMARSASCALISTRTMPLRPRHCPALLFDCTHDNPTPKEKRNARDALPTAALVAASCASIGSVRGYDELFPFNPSVVTERRLYQQIEGVPPLELGWPELTEIAPAAAAVVEDQVLEIIWKREASSSVVARGGWDGWKAEVPLARRGDGAWTAKLTLPSTALPVQYKFIVDGNWVTDPSQPTATDSSGNCNNVLGQGSKGGVAGTGSAAKVEGPDASVNKLGGIMTVKQVLNLIHVRLAQENFIEVGVQQLADDIVAVQRRAPDSGRRTWFIVRSAFSRHCGDENLLWNTSTLEVPGTIARLHVASTLFVPEKEYKCGDHTLSGLESYLHMYGALGDVANVWDQGGKTMLKLHHFPPGSVLVFSTNPNGEARARMELDQLLAANVVERPLSGLSLSELSHLLFSCEAEERDRSGGVRGAYSVAGFGAFVYCGLMGVCASLDRERGERNDLLESPIVKNIREGDWLLDYSIARLGDMPGLGGVKDWLAKVRALLVTFPRDLVPFHFDLAVSQLCAAACNMLLRNSGPFVATHGIWGRLVRDLGVGVAQFWGATPSAPLHWDRAQKEGWAKVPSLCAGLPHFASGFMRNWGRDTFIALRGCLLVTQKFAEARETLLVYASVIRHGLCPNLLDAANNPRYNARDATWFFMQAIQDYVELSPEGLGFLATPIALKYAVREWDGELAHLEPKTIADLVHLIFAAHAKGIQFREWNAGPAIDEHMTSNGFNIAVRLDEETGIVYGGNDWNCGTWMDKMGSSAKAGNKGVPATPRDGAAVEITGLLKSALRWVSGLPPTAFPHAAVKTASGKEFTYREWNERLQNHFEKLFWVSQDERAPTAIRCFYKDTVGATRYWQDYQLRPNFPIAMAVAPELFTPLYARQALATAAVRLLGPLGMCTLDPADLEYRGDYHNDNDTEDKAVAHGWNYHQGPEWVWPVGFFLRAWRHFCRDPKAVFEPAEEAELQRGERAVLRCLLRHREMLATSPWRSLPELTNSKGSECHHSCPAQAWSLATVLDALQAAGSTGP